MNTTNFCLEFDLNTSEIRKLNKMYFKDLYKEKVIIFSGIVLLMVIFFDFFDLNNEVDYLQWLLRNLVIIILFFSFQYSLVNTISKVFFQFTKKLLKYNRFSKKYKFNFSNSGICVHSPLGEFAHKWSQIEKAILTKDFFFLYVKDTNGYIISISNKCKNHHKIDQLIAFVEVNVTPIIKI
ncbi:YcxB family protein [Flavobacterium piscisymbiosum]|uniref:YcxB family protein n=1 Tax=Flavobacterium piscisymbiosum TaxID=2893753 RepID=A0ABS8MJD9_9FLAO|nr:YcxB family protein [Flavobacterium sp. F-30]MCC9065608.1 YcxB family protein [Flavobacterium sp. F-30]